MGYLITLFKTILEVLTVFHCDLSCGQQDLALEKGITPGHTDYNLLE